MAIKRYKNTLQKGSVRYIVFKEGNDWFAVGLEFNIVETGSTPQEAMMLLFEALKGYVETAIKVKARPDVLNQVPDKEYTIMWEERETEKNKNRIFTFGELNMNKRLVTA